MNFRNDEYKTKTHRNTFCTIKTRKKSVQEIFKL